MSKAFQRIGLLLMAFGIVLLAILYFTGLSVVNTFTLASLAIIILGLIIYVWGLKRDSLY